MYYLKTAIFKFSYYLLCLVFGECSASIFEHSHMYDQFCFQNGNLGETINTFFYLFLCVKSVNWLHSFELVRSFADDLYWFYDCTNMITWTNFLPSFLLYKHSKLIEMEKISNLSLNNFYFNFYNFLHNFIFLHLYSKHPH